MNDSTTVNHGVFARTKGIKDNLKVFGEIIAILLIVPVGLMLGALTGVLALAPILGTLAGLGVATYFLRRHGKTWADVGLKKPNSWLRVLLMVVGGFITATILITFVATPLSNALGLAPPDTSLFVNLIEDDLINYLLFLIPVSWGSAAIGEEMLARGFILNRVSAIFGYKGAGIVIAVIFQAFIFALGHLYQGVAGAINVFVMALVFGGVYIASNRNLVACILLHGLVDTIAMTAIYFGKLELLSL